MGCLLRPRNRPTPGSSAAGQARQHISSPRQCRDCLVHFRCSYLSNSYLTTLRVYRRPTEHTARGEAPRRRRELAQIARASYQGVISVVDAARVLALSNREAALRLSELSRAGWLARVRRGFYYVLPLEAPSASQTTPEDPWVLASRLYAPCYIAGWSAAEHWGLTEQIFGSTFVATAASIRARTETHLGAAFTLVRIKPESLERLSTVWRGRSRVHVSSPERTIVDGALDPRWVGGARHLAELVVSYAAGPKANTAALGEELRAVTSGAAAKRLGFLVEQLWPAAHQFVEQAYALRSSGVIKLDPAVKRRGAFSTRWRMWVNVTLSNQRTPADSGNRKP